jgi:outer membrane protein assembly factor BamA
MRSQGYMKAETSATRQYADARKTVEMEVAIKPGPRYKMGKLTIKGLDITTEPEIRKMWGLKEDAFFREGYAERVLAKIKEDGLLDNLGETSVKLDFDEPAERVNVALNFAGEKKEQPAKPKF